MRKSFTGEQRMDFSGAFRERNDCSWKIYHLQKRTSNRCGKLQSSFLPLEPDFEVTAHESLSGQWIQHQQLDCGE